MGQEVTGSQSGLGTAWGATRGLLLIELMKDPRTEGTAVLDQGQATSLGA